MMNSNIKEPEFRKGNLLLRYITHEQQIGETILNEELLTGTGVNWFSLFPSSPSSEDSSANSSE